MKKIIWIVGVSACGKETFIKKILNDQNTKKKYGFNKLKITKSNVSVDNIASSKEDYITLDKRNKISEEIKNLLPIFDVVLIKWQLNDTLTKRVDKIKNDFPEVSHEIFLIDTPTEIIFKRLPNKFWWSEERGEPIDFTIKEQKRLEKIIHESFSEYKVTRIYDFY